METLEAPAPTEQHAVFELNIESVTLGLIIGVLIGAGAAWAYTRKRSLVSHSCESGDGSVRTRTTVQT
jgi:TctA family transporter